MLKRVILTHFLNNTLNVSQEGFSVITSIYKYFRAIRLESFKTLGEMRATDEQAPGFSAMVSHKLL